MNNSRSWYHSSPLWLADGVQSPAGCRGGLAGGRWLACLVARGSRIAEMSNIIGSDSSLSLLIGLNKVLSKALHVALKVNKIHKTAFILASFCVHWAQAGDVITGGNRRFHPDTFRPWLFVSRAVKSLSWRADVLASSASVDGGRKVKVRLFNCRKSDNHAV